MAVRKIALLEVKEGVADKEQATRLIVNDVHAFSDIQGSAKMRPYAQIEDEFKFYCMSSEDDGLDAQTTISELLPVHLRHLYDIGFDLSVDLGITQVPQESKVLAIGRHFVTSGREADFEETFHSVKHHLENFEALRGIAYGWGYIPESGESVWLLFTGWDEVEQHRKFPDSSGFREFGRIKEFLRAIEIRHAVRL